MAERNGKRKTREELLRRRVPELGYYLIVTDTKETEKNYMNGLRESIPEGLRGKLVIKVSETKTEKLVSEAIETASLQPQYREPWIIFDRDRVKNFDQIIKDAEQNGIKAGWSNPCIEIWFSAYLGKMLVYDNSVACCNGFAQKYHRVTGKEYDKSDGSGMRPGSPPGQAIGKRLVWFEKLVIDKVQRRWFRGCGYFVGLFYAAKFKLRRYSNGLIAPSDIFILFSLYQCI